MSSSGRCPHVLEPLRTRLADDPSSAIRAWASASALDRHAGDRPAAGHRGRGRRRAGRPALLARAACRPGAADAPLPTLHRLIEVGPGSRGAGRRRSRPREPGSPCAAWSTSPSRGARAGWRSTTCARRFARGGAAARGVRRGRGTGGGRRRASSRLPRRSRGRLRRSGSPIREWRDDLLRAGRAIVERERLTRRHAVDEEDRPALARRRRRVVPSCAPLNTTATSA